MNNSWNLLHSLQKSHLWPVLTGTKQWNQLNNWGKKSSLIKLSIFFYKVPVPSKVNDIFASQGLRFGSPFSPPLADLEHILKFARNATWWFIEVAPLDSRHRQPIRIVLLYVCWRVENGSAQWRKNYLW
jgi:hypothetical protein